MNCAVCGCPNVKWLRVSTVAKQFGCSARKVRRFLHSGCLEGVLFGRDWRVDHASLDRFVQGQLLEGPAQAARTKR